MDKRKTRVGTPFWMAPEVITESSYDGCADIWSTGITAIELVTGSPPYANKVHPMQVIFLIPKNPPPVLEGSFSSEFKDFVEKCLQKEASKRPTAQQLLDHPFIKNATKTESLIKIAQHKCEVNQARHENDLAELEQKGMNRVLSSDIGWDFSMRSQNSGAFNSLGSFSGTSIEGSKDVNDMTMPRLSRAHSASSYNSPTGYPHHGDQSPGIDLTPTSKASYQLKTASTRSYSLLVESPIREGLINSSNPHYYNIKDNHRYFTVDNKNLHGIYYASKCEFNYLKIPAYIAHYVNQSEETYIKRKVNFPRDDTGEKRHQENIKDIHNQFNTIENTHPKKKYANQVKLFLKQYGHDF
jgi:serine/threonine protein kinase